MEAFTWTDELSVGVEVIDDDHKLLIGLINLLNDAVDGGEGQETVGSVLNALYDYTDYHFEREETLMAACGYPDLARHAKIHQRLKAQVIEIRDEYLRDPEAVLGAEVLDFLKNWLNEHIRGRDKEYAPYMAAKPKEVEPTSRSFAQKLEQSVSDDDPDESLL